MMKSIIWLLAIALLLAINYSAAAAAPINNFGKAWQQHSLRGGEDSDDDGGDKGDKEDKDSDDDEGGKKDSDDDDDPPGNDDE
jgi:hypothetical protein